MISFISLYFFLLMYILDTSTLLFNFSWFILFNWTITYIIFLLCLRRLWGLFFILNFVLLIFSFRDNFRRFLFNLILGGIIFFDSVRLLFIIFILFHLFISLLIIILFLIWFIVWLDRNLLFLFLILFSITWAIYLFIIFY